MKFHTIIIYLFTLLASVSLFSCSEDEPAPACETNNTGDLIVANNYSFNPNSFNSLAVFINRDPSSSNTAGDLNIAYEEQESIILPAGVHTIKVYLNTGSCSDNRCTSSREYLGERIIDLSQCEALNLAYGG